ncbi:MAG: hypothetical protein HKP57_11700 [Halobacteria archaeon]|nr:hypothetical protein [Halobacteria archaeon]
MFDAAVNRLRILASLKLTLLGIIALLLGVLLSYFSREHSSLYINLPLALLAANLLAAIVFNPRIRQNTGLLMFHICLLMIALLTMLSQLTSMKGRVEIVQGTAFDANSVTLTKQGAWHPLDRLQRVGFVQGDITVDYVAGLRRGATRSQLLPAGSDAVVIGDNLAFTSQGYRFYTSSNKGFAAIINWYSKEGQIARGAIHFPSYPLYDWKQHNQWQAPSGERLDFRLMIETPLDSERDWTLRNTENGTMELILPDKTVRTLKPGEYIQLDHGLLEFEAIRMWMGYKIFFDPFLAWFFAAALVGVAGLGWHYYLKLSSPGKTHRIAGENVGRGRAVSTTQS